MSAGRDVDLSGRWTGLFSYPIPSPPTHFQADIRDAAGLIAGETSEPDGTPGCLGRTLRAVIEGRRSGHVVRFVKMYDELDGDYDLVHYQGAIGADGDEIEGRWDIPGAWAGTFLMIRASGAEEEVARKAAEPIVLDVEAVSTFSKSD